MAKKIIKAEEIFKVDAGVAAENGSISGMLPMTPWVEIQFRTNVLSDDSNINKLKPTTKNDWTTVTARQANSETYVPPSMTKDPSSLKFDNYFENITLSDNGGIVNCNMRLFDKEIGRLENIIVKSMLASKAGNDILTRKLDEVPATSVLTFMPNPSSNINFRIRFGYSDPTSSPNVYEPALKSSPDWKDRTSEKKMNSFYKKSPWIYFMMMDVVFQLDKLGVSADIKGISISNTYLDKTKILKRFALMEGTPQRLFRQIGKQLYKATGGRVQVVDGELASRTSDMIAKPILPDGISKALGKKIDYGEPSDLPIQWAITPEEGGDNSYPDNLPTKIKNEIERDYKWLNISLSLGGEPRYEIDSNGQQTSKIINEFMSVKNLINDFISKVPSILYNKISGKYITDPEIIKQIMDNNDKKYDPTSFQPITYTYSINEQTTEVGTTNAETDTIVLIRFFYRRLDKTSQEYVRSYDYMNSPTTLITNFGIKSSMDFIQLNQSVAIKNGDKIETSISTSSIELDDNEGSTPADTSNLSKNVLETDDLLFVSNIQENNGGTSSNLVANKFIQNMNEGIFSGELEILGDPFYLFDEKLQPFQYYIRINVYRSMNEYKRESSNNKLLNASYLTGYYLIKGISHNLSASGFKTTLNLQRYSTTGIEKIDS